MKILRPVVLLIGIVTLVVQALGIRGVWRGVGQPFPGFVVSRELIVTQLNQPYWSGIRAGLRPGDRILSVYGEELRSARHLIRRVRAREAGSFFEYRVARGNDTFVVPVRSLTFTLSDFFSTFGILGITGAGFLLMGTAVAWLRRDQLGGGVYALCFAIAYAMGVSPDLAWSHEFPLSKLWYPFLIAGLVHFALVFPRPKVAVRRRPWLLAAPYLLMLPLALADVASLLGAGRMVAHLDPLVRWGPFAASIGLVLSVCQAYFGARTAEQGPGRLVRERIRITFWGLALAVACYATGFLGAEFGILPSAPTSMFVIPAWIWFGTVGIAALRDDVFDLGDDARDAFVRPAVFGMMMTFYLLLFGGVLLAFRRAGFGTGWAFPLGFLLVAVILVEPLRRLARIALGWAMNTASVLPPRVLREISAEIGSSLDRHSIVTAVRGIAGRLGLRSVRLFLAGGGGWAEAGGLGRLAKDHPLVVTLQEEGRLPGAAMPPSERRRRAREAMEALGITAAFALRSGGRPIGFLGFGEPLRGRSISGDDLEALATLSSQVGVAVENSSVFERVRELEEELRAENVVLREELLAAPDVEGLVGQSPKMRQVYDWISQVAPMDTTVLVRGETGTGKELVARAIHARSLRRARPMIRVNCAAMPPALLESEFFGHERGAFTDAWARKRGRFELAAGGTIFLDEIGDLPADLQPKLLRVLQEKEFERVGGSATIHADVRVIAATNRDLESLVRTGQFREDLFFRLNVFPIVVPPLRDRREDIPMLIGHLLRRHTARLRKPITTIDERSLRALLAYRWPGNVRELENLIERAIVLAAGEHLVIRDLEPPDIARETVRAPLRPLSEILRDVKVQTIRRALTETAGNQAHAATMLGVKASSLSRMMRTLGLRDH